MKSHLENDLKKLFSKDQLFTSLEERLCYSYDATNKSFLPDAIVIPHSTEDVVKLTKYAHQHKIIVIPRGAGTGYTGGSLPIEGGIVVTFEQMTKVLLLDKEKKYAVVEPGLVTQEFADYVNKFGLLYPPDPASLKSSTLGGNVVECSGGLKGRKYGVTKNYVIGLEIVLSDGQIIRTGVLSARGGSAFGGNGQNDNSYDLEALLIGSEGTLGLVTKIAFRLLDKVKCEETVLATFDKMEDAAEVVAAITVSGIIPSVLEFIDGDTLTCVLEYIQVDNIEKSEAVLLIEVDGNDKEEVRQEFDKILKICKEKRAKNLQYAETKEEKDKLWTIRRSISASLLRIAPTKVNEDICVPPSKLPAMIKNIQELSQKHQVRINTFGHAGDGNLHVTFMCDFRNKEQMERVEAAVEELFDLTLKLGGTLSGEHGIGITKIKYLENEVGKSGIDLMRKIKSAFDPEHIINPGKIFS
ncbi:MAG: FAD-binding protein [candidate division Zixibacteria bacterium]|nr:FAD-binding protein [candidate division Zixibacteria bacterium]